MPLCLRRGRDMETEKRGAGERKAHEGLLSTSLVGTRALGPLDSVPPGFMGSWTRGLDLYHFPPTVISAILTVGPVICWRKSKSLPTITTSLSI